MNPASPKTRKGTGAMRYSAPALEKGLAVLELLAREAAPLSQAQVAKALGRNANELFRMLSVLERRRYIRRDSLSGKYSLSLKLFRLGQTVGIVEQLKAAAAGPMREFSEETGQECHLSVLEEGRLVVVHQAAGRGPIRLSIEPGSEHCPVQTASGRKILAQMDPQERAAELELVRVAFPGSRGGQPDWEQLRREPVHWAEDETLVGLADAAVAVTVAGGIRAALAASLFRTGISTRMRTQLGRRLQALAASVQSELGVAEL